MLSKDEDVVINLTGDIEADEQHFDENKISFSRLVMHLPSGLQTMAPMAMQWAQQRRNNVRPWTTFLATSSFKTPASISRLTSRVIKNIEHFQSNYMFVFIGLIIFCLLTSPLLLLAVAASLGACYILALKNVERQVVIAGREVALAHQYAAVAVMSIPIFYLAGAGSAIFWVIGASFFLIVLHASFYNIDSILGSDEEPFELQMEQV